MAGVDVPPPVRRPRLRKLRIALIATGAVVVALLLAWMPGRARVSVTCGVCGTSADSTDVGLFWDDDPFVAVSLGGDEQPSPLFTDALAARGHVHSWQTQRSNPMRSIADLVVRRTYCPRPPHASHAGLLWYFNSQPASRTRIAALIDEKAWTLRDIEDALLWCDDVSCPFNRHDLPQETSDRRSAAVARFRQCFDAFATPAR
jgi:hypothetical protein